MRCEDVLVLIDACVDGELSTLNRWRVGRHIRSCAACAAELRAAERQRGEAQKWRNETAPDALHARIAANLAAAPWTAANPDVDSSAHLASGAAPGKGGDRRHGPLRHKQRVGIATLLVPVCALLCWMVLQGQKPLSYAQVRKAMQGVQTVHWSMEMTFELPAGASGGTGNPMSPGPYTLDCWARLNPPAIVGNDHGTYRSLVEGPGPGMTVSGPSGRDMLSFRPQDGAFSLMFPAEMLRALGVKPHLAGDEADSLWHGKPVMQGGHSLVRFTRTVAAKPAAVEQAAPEMIAPVMKETILVLADPVTHRIMSIEYTVTTQFTGSAMPLMGGMPGPTTTVKLKDMAYDVAAPQGAFDQ